MSKAVYAEAIDAVHAEATKTTKQYGDFASMHEALGVLQEEVAEFFDAVRLSQSHPGRPEKLRAEAIQIGAIALRIIEQADRVTR